MNTEWKLYGEQRGVLDISRSRGTVDLDSNLEQVPGGLFYPFFFLPSPDELHV